MDSARVVAVAPEARERCEPSGREIVMSAIERPVYERMPPLTWDFPQRSPFVQSPAAAVKESASMRVGAGSSRTVPTRAATVGSVSAVFPA